MIDLVLVGLVVFAINLLPAFGPPTWAVLVALTVTADVPAVGLVLCGALAAASGRLVLGSTARRLRGRLSERRRISLEALRGAVEDRKAGAVAGLALFALSPVPSAQLFLAAGITGVRLVPLTAAFFAGRLVSYSIYVGAASAAEERFGSVIRESLGSPVSIAVQVALLAGLVALVRVDWVRVLERHHGPRACIGAK